MAFKVAPYMLLIILLTINSSNGSNILFFWGMTGVSHRFTVWPLVEKLAERGHNITYFSPHPAKKPTRHPNITEMIPDDLFKIIGMDYDPAEVRIRGGVEAVERLWPSYLESGIRLCDFITTNKDMLNWANNSSYDLVFVNGLFNECGFGLAYKFNAPTILYGSSSLFQWWGEVYGLPEENYPEFTFHMPINMTFTQQVWNTLTPLVWSVFRSWYFLPKLEKSLRPALNIPDMPPLLELEKQTNLILINTHFSEEYPRSLPPLFVPIGGMHCTDKRSPLPENITNFIEYWENGFIYFSFGTYMKLPLLPKQHRDAIFGAIRKFPSIGFLLKWNGGEVPTDLPENVMTAEWMAQQDILAHPNVRAFISHGGLLGTQEAVYHAVPIIVFPIFAEQDYNAERIHSTERGIMLEISDLSQEKLEGAIKEILTNKKYKRNMEKTSQIFKDRPQKPVDTAIWWVEYVLRHKNTTFLSPIGVHRTWYERKMLHIWAFIASVVLAVLAVTFTLLRIIFVSVLNMMTKQNNTTKKKVQ